MNDSIAAIIDKIEAGIANRGYVTMSVFPETETDAPPFCYTIGNTAVDKPEFIISGLPPEMGVVVVESIVDLMLDGKLEPADGLTVDLQNNEGGYKFKLVALDDRLRDEYMRFTKRHYPNKNVTAYQIVWPDKEHNYPGDANMDAMFNRVQTLYIRDQTKLN